MIKIEDIKPVYKKTPVGIIPEDWEVKKIKELIKDSYLGGNYKNILEKDFHTEKTPLIKMGNIGRGRIDLDSFYSIDDGEEVDEKHLLKKGDVLFNTRNTLELVGKVAIWREEYPKAYFNSNLLKLIPNKKSITNDFLNLQLNSFNGLRQLRAVATGTTSVAAIYERDIKKIKLPIPPLPEQKAIADCLSTWDRVIAKQTQLINTKKELKNGLMEGFFNGQLRVTNGVVIKTKEGENFTKDWVEVKLGIHFKERKETGFKDKELLSIGEDGVYPQSESNKKDTSNANKSKYKLIKPGDIGYNTMRLWQGRCALSSLEGIVSPAYTILKPVSSRTVPEFFAYYFKMESVIHKFYRNSQGMVSDTLQCRYRDFKNIKMRVPSFEEQTAIAQILQIIDQEIELLENKLGQLQLQKKGLMQVLLTGKKRLV